MISTNVTITSLTNWVQKLSELKEQTLLSLKKSYQPRTCLTILVCNPFPKTLMKLFYMSKGRKSDMWICKKKLIRIITWIWKWLLRLLIISKGSPLSIILPMINEQCNFFTWNYRGTMSKDFMRVSQNYMCMFKADMFVALETRFDPEKLHKQMQKLGFDKLDFF